MLPAKVDTSAPLSPFHFHVMENHKPGVVGQIPGRTRDAASVLFILEKTNGSEVFQLSSDGELKTVTVRRNSQVIPRH